MKSNSMSKDTCDPKLLALDLVNLDSEQEILATLGSIVAGFTDLAALEVFLDDLHDAADKIGTTAKAEIEVLSLEDVDTDN